MRPSQRRERVSGRFEPLLVGFERFGLPAAGAENPELVELLVGLHDEGVSHGVSPPRSGENAETDASASAGLRAFFLGVSRRKSPFSARSLNWYCAQLGSSTGQITSPYP